MGKQMVEVDVPDGWEAVAYRNPMDGENYLNEKGAIVPATFNMTYPWLVVRKIEKPPKYRPFKDADDFVRHYRGQWVTGDDWAVFQLPVCVMYDRVELSSENVAAFRNVNEYRLVSFTETGERIETPFGVLVEDGDDE